LPWKKVLPWKSKFCREKVSFVVEKNFLSWKSKFCREKESFAVEKKVLPWQIWATVGSDF